MSETSIESGVVLGFGGTNARYGIAEDGDVVGFRSVLTPEQPEEFFGWMARQALSAADRGYDWLVAGFPGPITAKPSGLYVGPMSNVPGLANSEYNLLNELVRAEKAVDGLVSAGFSIYPVNDGELAAQAAAVRVGENKYVKTAALILGTGVGTGVVSQDPSLPEVHRADSNPNEIGHVMLSTHPRYTFENYVSGPALERDFGSDPSVLPPHHEAWQRVGETVGRLATMLGLLENVTLVVPCGGLGSGASDKYWPYLSAAIETYKELGNGPQQKFLPDIKPVPTDDAQIFELFGGEAVVRDYRTRHR